MKKAFVFILKTIGVLLGIVGLYIVLGLLLPLIKVPAEETSDPKTIPMYIYTNGMHTDLVVPIKTEVIDWSQQIPFENTLSKRTDFSYVGIGWGDKGFYLDTPTWADLKVSTAIKAAFWMSESAMHCTFYEKMQENDDCKKIMLTEKQYSDLVKFIKNQFKQDENGNFILIKTDAVYGKNDAFYDAKESYNFMQTCNTWANNGLKTAGQKAALWTPSDFGIFYHYR